MSPQRWTFDDGTFATSAQPTKVFKIPGVYTVRLTVTDNHGNNVTRSLPIHVAAVTVGNPSFADNQFSFFVNGMTNFNHTVQFSTNLTNWVSLQTNRGPFTYTDTNSTVPPRYFRALAQP